MRMLRPILVSLVLGVLLAGCGAFTVDQRYRTGPTAENLWKARFKVVNGRNPSFTEKQHFKEDMDLRVQEYLRQNPDVANSFRVGNLRLFREVSVGMRKVEITLLLGEPQETTEDPVRMELLARKYWPVVKPHAKEAWIYPSGWTLYFDGDKLSDITRYHRAFLHP